MRISTNNIGNYTLNNIKTNAVKETVNPAVDKSLDLNKKEKAYFINTYPENKTEVTDYHFYKRSGTMSGVTVGTLLDKRG